LRIPTATFDLLDDEMVVRQDLDTDRREVVFTLKMPAAEVH
jgi:hypothetical protein